MKTKKFKTVSLSTASRNRAGKLIGMRVTDGVRFGTITKQEIYDSDTTLSVERITVSWDDGSLQRKSPREWHGEARGPVGSRATAHGWENDPAYLSALASSDPHA